MNERIHNLMNYLDSAHSVFHAVEGLKNILEENGYIRLQESGKWDLQPGGKYFMTRGGASIMAFRIPECTPKGFMMSASHADRPCFKVKENGELVGKYTKLAVERYGGMLMGTWLDRPCPLPAGYWWRQTRVWKPGSSTSTGICCSFPMWPST